MPKKNGKLKICVDFRKFNILILCHFLMKYWTL
jgi:hypothetical protein